MSNTPQQDSSLSPSSSMNGNRVDFTFHLFCGLHISYMFRSKHMPMVPECSSPFPSVTQWFLPSQLLGNLSTDASGASTHTGKYFECSIPEKLWTGSFCSRCSDRREGTGIGRNGLSSQDQYREMVVM